jgi:hypothetical protein
MLQGFYIDVAKVDQDIAHVAMTIHVCFKCIFLMFHTYIASVVSVCFIYIYACCKRMFQVFRVFHTYVASVSSKCCICLQWLHTCFQIFSGVCKCFRHMLQVFHLNIAYVCNGYTRVFKFF